ncbi:hypothetical protein V1517DRAFT_329790 [Lipomyces orientalis]|uniref:Uncharacterized protein n=1 Tax=Lipomyces orientalis TaxID=1233043 RepID=A0ACC3THS2_9ASCO
MTVFSYLLLYSLVHANLYFLRLATEKMLSFRREGYSVLSMYINSPCHSLLETQRRLNQPSCEPPTTPSAFSHSFHS